MKKILGTVAIAALLSGPPQFASAEEVATVRINQAFQSLLYLSLYVANDAGFFDEEGLDVKVTTGGGGSQAWSAVLGGSAEYSIHDPVFPTISREQGGPGIVVGTICNAETIYALAKKPDIKLTTNFEELLSKGYKISTQPQPDSGWARLTYLAQKLNIKAGDSTYTNVQVPIGSEMASVFAGQTDIGLSYPPVVELAEEQGLHVTFSFTAASRPYLFSSLNTTQDFIEKNPETHQKVMNAFEKASQYIYRYPEEAVKIAVKEFPDLDEKIVRKAVERMISELAYPEHVFAEYNAFTANQKLHQFVGTIKQPATAEEGLNNTAALAAYQSLGRISWDASRPISKTVTQ
ncbi:ABC transporter substrate-binding protein [Mesorhizobium sp.]|uniref:ABC transporter substrate-binding protein n=1 Tax=Mesorhizobium sp. TaxID=1871066 RepID=UPI000FE609F4|nr:ABC transporter substrate-binding protein [Mesorhizobium sp.]RWP99091.1 MAG: ABC transporter substrate-binding protein [Mesorhizobium sp.]